MGKDQKKGNWLQKIKLLKTVRTVYALATI